MDMTPGLARLACRAIDALADSVARDAADRRNVHALLERNGAYVVVGRGVTRHHGRSSYRVSGSPTLHRPAIG